MVAPGKPEEKRLRARELDLPLGQFEPGRYNAITDVEGVLVGHSTIVRGDGQLVPGEGPVRTGVTAILPHGGNMFGERVPAALFVRPAPRGEDGLRVGVRVR